MGAWRQSLTPPSLAQFRHQPEELDDRCQLSVSAILAIERVDIDGDALRITPACIVTERDIMRSIPHDLDEAGLDRELKGLIADVLGLEPAQAEAFGPESGLFGHLPELDSMAVAGLLTEMEDRLGIVIEDDDVDGEMLETYGGLLAFAKAKLDPR